MASRLLVGTNNVLTSTFDTTAKTLKINGCTAFDLTLESLEYIWSTTASKEIPVSPLTNCVRTWVAGSPVFTYTFASLPSGVANGDTLLIYLQIPAMFTDFLVLQTLAT